MKYEWEQTAPRSFQRRVVGGEKMFDFLERNNHGHGEGCLSVMLDISSTTLSRRRLENKMKNGYARLYVQHPLVCCTLETETMDEEQSDQVTFLRYRQPETAEQAQQLIHSHINFVGLENPADLPHYVLNRRIGEGDNRRGTMYVAFGRKEVCVTFHVSHVVYDPFYGVRAYNDLLGFIAEGRSDKVDFSIMTDHITFEEMQRRLPISLAFAYEQQCSPTAEDKEAGITHWQELLADSAEKTSILIPSDGDPSLRKHKRCVSKMTVTARETAELIAFCKSIGLPLICLLGASYLYSIAEMYGTGEADGIKVTVPLPVQQWLDVNPSQTHGPVSCAIMAGLVWVRVKDAGILDIALSLGQAMQAQLADGPHSVGKEAQDALLVPYFNSVASTSSVHLPPGFPGLTFVGNVARVISRSFKDPTTDFEMHVKDVYMGTKPMTNRAWMLGSIWDGKLSAEAYFDEKYLDQARMDLLVRKTVEGLLAVLPAHHEEQRQSRL